MKVYKMVLAAMFLALAMVLPFLTGQIPQIGSALCPMHIPVLLCGFFCGPWYALAVGFIAPLLRFLIFGMPPIMPTGIAMCFELATYGFMVGFLYKKLPKKKVIPIYILCFSLGVAITLLAYIVPSKLDKKKAFESYQNGNYEETYALLKGNKLNEKEQLTYDRAVVLLKAQRKLDSYNNYISLGMRTEALNALVQGAKEAAELRENAETLGVGTQFDSIYRNIIEELNNSFGVSEDKVEEWIQIDDLEEYTLTLNRYLNRTGAGDTVDNKTEDQIIAGEESEIENENEPFIENEPDDNADFDEIIAAEEAEF